MSERLTGTLPGHFDEAKLSKVTHRHPGAVLSDAAAKFSKNSRPVFVTRHIDKVDDDDAAQIPKPQLPGDRLRRFQVRFENRVAEILLSDKTSGIHVNR